MPLTVDFRDVNASKGSSLYEDVIETNFSFGFFIKFFSQS